MVSWITLSGEWGVLLKRNQGVAPASLLRETGSLSKGLTPNALLHQKSIFCTNGFIQIQEGMLILPISQGAVIGSKTNIRESACKHPKTHNHNQVSPSFSCMALPWCATHSKTMLVSWRQSSSKHFLLLSFEQSKKKAKEKEEKK